MLHGVIDDTWSGHADIQHRFRFAYSMKGARHEWIVINGIGEADEFSASQAAAIARPLGSVFN
jgi:hypothetical protein